MHSESRRQLTSTWWDRDRAGFNLFASPLVLAECEAGDPTAAERRLEVLRAIPLLEINDEAVRLEAQGVRSRHNTVGLKRGGPYI
jgi:hypothetical protein